MQRRPSSSLFLLAMPLGRELPDDLRHLIAAYRALCDAQHEMVLTWIDSIAGSQDDSYARQERDKVLDLCSDVRRWAEVRYWSWRGGLR